MQRRTPRVALLSLELQKVTAALAAQSEVLLELREQLRASREETREQLRAAREETRELRD